MKIFVEAFLDKNFGDDLMVQMLAKELRDHDIYLYCDNDVLTTPFKENKNIHIYKKTRGRRTLSVREMKQFDAYVRIGGSIFAVRNYRELFRRILNLPKLLILKLFGVKLLVLGCNLGPFNSRYAEIVVKWDLCIANLVTVRDRNSFELLDDRKRHNTLYFPDIVLGSIEETKELSENRDCLGISVYRSVYNPSLNNIEYEQMALIADQYIERTGTKVLLIALDSENENDIAAAYNILDRVKHKEMIEVIVHVSDPKKVISHFGRCRSLVAIRFHAAIMAMLLDIPFLPVVYSNKMENMLDDIGYTGRRLYFDNLSNVDPTEIVDILIETENIVNQIDPGTFLQARGHLTAARNMIEGRTFKQVK